MNNVNFYLDAAERINTRRSYESAIRHFEVEWGGLLPSTIDNIARYLAEHAESHSLNTLKHRLAALSRWHQDHGFPDPTKAPKIRQIVKGIRAMHPAQEKRAKPLELDILQRVCESIENARKAALKQGDMAGALRHTRDRALVLLGFWRGFRSDELVNLRVEFIEIKQGEGMTCFLPRSKGDRQLAGRSYSCPALPRLCPVEATEAWLGVSKLTDGPLFRKIDYWGHLSNDSLAPGSIIPILRRLLTQAGVADTGEFSSHSLRRGFANWARLSGWDMRELMDYVGWRDVKAAMRYLDGTAAGIKERFEQGLGSTMTHSNGSAPKLVPALPALPEIKQKSIEVTIQLTPYTGNKGSKNKALRRKLKYCLAKYRVQPIDNEENQYQIFIPTPNNDMLNDHIYALLDELHQVADAHQCFLDAVCRDPISGKRWD